MGGDFYSNRIPPSVRLNPDEYFQHSHVVSQAPPEERKVHPTLDPRGVTRECRDLPGEHPDTTPIPVIFDLTDSRGQDTEIVCQKLPSMIGQIGLNGYVPDPELMFMGIGDATVDKAPVQVGQFESDSRLDDHLRNIWIERGGGGTGQESYQLGAYFLARHTALDCARRGKLATAFFLGDEGFYPTVSAAEVKRIFGDKLEGDIPSAKVFAEMQKLYRAFLILPRSSWKDRKTHIDSEIRQRVQRAGGLVEGVELRFSLAWDDKDDLDLHVVTPGGEHLYYAHRRESGRLYTDRRDNLDVDANAHEPFTPKPVENMRWPKGQAAEGDYQVWVERYAFHKGNQGASPFRAEMEMNGQTVQFEGVMPANATHGQSRFNLGPNNGIITFKRGEAPAAVDDGRYDLYDESVVIAQWSSVIPPEHILRIEDPKSCVDVMLGALALSYGTRTLELYLKDLKVKEQTGKRIEQVATTLKDYAASLAGSRITIPIPQGHGSGHARRTSTGSRRL